jgi:hypothetical protein
MKDLTGSAFIEDWNNIPITVYVDSNVRFGRDTVEGLRISKEKPRLQKPELMVGTPAWERAIAAYKRDKNFDAIEKHMTVSDASKTEIKKEAGDVD